MELDFNVLWKVAAVVFAAGGLWNELRAIRKDLSRLESKQDKYNNLQGRVASLEDKLPTLSGLPERVARVEDSCASAHHRITEVQNEHRY
nr:MAG TPA: Pilus assembly protein, PilO [Caudoviricetes sp.]